MMTENYIKINTSAKIKDELATQKDKRKAYQIFLFSGILSTILTVGMYMFFLNIS